MFDNQIEARILKRAIRFTAAFLVLTCTMFTIDSTKAAVINAKSVALVDVAAAIVAAADGDTVAVPVGTASWKTPLVITKAITLQGAGIGQTIVLDDLSSDDSNIHWTTSRGKSYRLTGFEFRAGARTTRFYKSCVFFDGNSQNFRLDHCKWFRVNNRFIKFKGALSGVMDHCVTDSTTQTSLQHMEFNSDTWNGGLWGDGSWAVPVNWGTTEGIYVEDNEFTAQDYYALTDAYNGARWVFRYNTVKNATITDHGTGSTGRSRSHRSWEIYNNTIIFDPPNEKNAIHLRGGTGVIFNNLVIGAGKFAQMKTYRFFENFYAGAPPANPWVGSEGETFWDLNATNGSLNNPPSDPTGKPNTVGTVYASGTAGPGSGDTILAPSPAPKWTSDQWVGYTVRWTTSSPLYPQGWINSCVVSNTATTLTVSPGSQVVSKPFANGDTFEIRKVVQGLDQIGASTGDDLAGSYAPRWLNQSIEPAYIWNNSYTAGSSNPVADAGWGGFQDSPIVGATIAYGSATPTGAHFVNVTGVGPVENVGNVAYSGRTPDPYPKPSYTPLVHPHPLAVDAGDAPSQPTNLQIVP